MKIKTYKADFYNGTQFSEVEDVVSVEVALSISINQIPFTVTMQTPGCELELTRGLLFTENIFKNSDFKPKISVLSFNQNGYINSVDVQIPPEYVLKDFAGTRNVISASSCGICGKTSIDDSDCEKVMNTEILEPQLIPKMFEKVSLHQQDFQKSGGTHACGAFTIDGEMICIFEDIGRHNAVDKVIGYLFHHNLMNKVKCLTVSGRISYEIVSKTKVAGIPFLAAVSAPSSLAIDYAEESGITLMAFCRNSKFTVYSNKQRVAHHDETLIENEKENINVK